MATADLKPTAGGGGGGWIMVRDIVPTASGAVGTKTYQTPEDDVLLTCETDTLGISVVVNATGPKAKVAGVDVNLTKIPGESYYEGTQPITITGTGTVTAVQVLPDGTDGAEAAVTVTVVAAPVILTCVFTGGYPGAQTELAAGDTFQITGTTDTDAVAVVVADFEAFDAAELVMTGTAFTVTGTIANRGTTVQDLAARVSAKNASGSVGATFDTDSTGTVDGVNRVKLNNVQPSFTDNGTTFPGGQLAFKGTEPGSQDTTVLNYSSVTYSSPNGDFAIGTPGTYVQNKPITCANPGTYNDSVTNFRIVANRAANGTSATFNKTIEVADIAPVVTVSQPQARLRSGGAIGTSPQDYVITATSNQNLAGAPSVNVVVSGSWQGGAFVGGPKIWTRTLRIDDVDAKGTAPWTFTAAPLNNAGTAAGIAGTQVNGGFVFRTMTVSVPFARETAIGTQVADTAKLQCSNLGKGGSGSLNFTYTPAVADVVDEYTITQPSGVFNAVGNLWYNKDAANAASNSGGTMQVELEEVV